MPIHYPDNTASRTPIVASGLTDSTALLDIYSGGERSLTLAELKKTGVQVLNAKQYGLRGDGITDDTTNFLLFCSGAASANLVAYFPPGTYLLNSLPTYGYQVSSNLRVLGENATLKGNSTSGHDEPFTLISGADFTCEGITFDTFYLPIWGESTFDGTIKVHNCTFTNMEAGVAIDSAATPSLIVIEDSEFYDFTHYGILVRGITNATVRVCRNVVRDSIESTTHTGINIGDAGIVTSRSILVDGNHIYNVQCTAINTLIGMFVSGEFATIINNTLKNVYSASRGTTSDAGIYSKATGGMISNNTLINAGRGNGCIVWKGGINNCAISNNIINMSDNTQDWFTGIRAYIDNAIISDNVLNGLSGNIQTGLELGETPLNVDVLNNKFIDCVYASGSHYTITSNAGSNLRINNNSISRCGSSYNSAIVSYGIRVVADASTSNVEIRNNRLEDSVRGNASAYEAGISVAGTATGNSGIVISDNTIMEYGIGIYIPTGGYLSSVDITNNTIDVRQCGYTGGTTAGIYAHNLKYGRVSNNIILNVSGSIADVNGGILLVANVTSGINNLSVNDNTLLNLGSTTIWWGQGIYISTSGYKANAVDITRNIVRVARRGIEFWGAADDTNITITDNAIYNIVSVTSLQDYGQFTPSSTFIAGNMKDSLLHSFNTSPLLTASATFLKSSVALTQGSGASTATLTNSPTVGNPTKWIPINDNGTTRYIPCW